MATDLVTACKIGLNMDTTDNSLDGVLSQKILAVKTYMSNAGVNTTNIDSDLGTGTIVLGVTDMWTLNGGEATFSTMFINLVNQLAYISYADDNPPA